MENLKLLETAERENAELRAELAKRAEKQRRLQAQRNAELAERKRRVAENKREILFIRQALQAAKIRQALELEPEQRIRELERSNALYRQLLAEQALELELALPLPPVVEDPVKTMPESEYYLVDYAKRLEQAKIANRVREQRNAEEAFLVYALAIVIQIAVEEKVHGRY